MYEKKPPTEGDLRYEVTPIYKESMFDFKKIDEQRILKRYDGHEWQRISEYYHPMIEL